MKNRIKNFQKQFEEWNVDSFLIENPVDLLYLTGMKVSRGRLWVGPHESAFLVDGRYFAAAKIQSLCPVFLWEDKPRMGRIGFDSSYTTIDGLSKLKKESTQAVFVPISRPLRLSRLIKDREEIKKLRKAAEITWDGIGHVKSLFREGVSERELAAEFDFFVRKKGADGLAFESIVAFGENSAFPHHRASDSCLLKNQIVLIDVGAVFANYCADVTRVFFFGEANPKLKQMLEIVRAASKEACKQIRPGVDIKTIGRLVADFLSKNGVEELMTHGLGHGIGLEGHESPLIRWDGEDQMMIFQENMAIAVEPGLYLPKLGGVRHENSGIVTARGFESFYPEM